MASPTSPYLSIPQCPEGNSTGGAEEQLRVELIGPAGKLAEGVMDVSRLLAVGEQHALTAAVEPASPVQNGIVTEVALFSVVNGKNGTRQRCGTLELVVQSKTSSPALSAMPPLQSAVARSVGQPGRFMSSQPHDLAVPSILRAQQASFQQPLYGNKTGKHSRCF
jgi:hypothetical protein